ncbi:MAG: cytochrome-c peroxidase [Archangium sp.]|nr:cytochrome-c peroxidase [Archangium sp.]
MHPTPFAVALVAAGVALAQTPPLEARAKSLFKPLPKQFESKDNPITADKVALGKLLYFDTRLSKSQTISCNSCHDLAKYGVDGEPTSPGHKKQRGGRNSPTVFNAGNHIAQFWDGRAKDLEAQAMGPVLNPIEMALPDAHVVEAVLKSIPGYPPLFAKAFPADKEPVTFANMARAIGAFERTLVTPSRFDAYLAGDAKALTDAEKKGLDTFISVGCVACHVGEGVGGGMYQRLGFAVPVASLKDFGRFDATKVEADKHFFRVPSLRNVEKTAPYLHDGSVKTLDEMVKFMAKYQLNRELKADEVTSIVTFLKSLTGPLPVAAISPPKPLPSGKDTPKPDLN